MFGCCVYFNCSSYKEEWPSICLNVSFLTSTFLSMSAKPTKVFDSKLRKILRTKFSATINLFFPTAAQLLLPLRSTEAQNFVIHCLTVMTKVTSDGALFHRLWCNIKILTTDAIVDSGWWDVMWTEAQIGAVESTTRASWGAFMGPRPEVINAVPICVNKSG